MAAPTKAKNTVNRKKSKKQITEGHVYVIASFNNTKITITDRQGEVKAKSTSASCGFRGSKKGTPYAAQVAAETAAKDAIDRLGMQSVDVFVNGPGPGRDSAIRQLHSAGLKITSITDITGIPHNGCRPPKKRRV